MKRALQARHALLPDGWATDVLLEWDDHGRLLRVQPGASAAADVERLGGALLPGLVNLHSHAFQRAFAGLTEHLGDDPADSFWSWREQMYRFALAVGPDELERIAAHLYAEMLEAGYTSVCEFHYLHHDPAGRRYADPAEMATRLAAAARQVGIGLTLLPVLYCHSGFGNRPPAPRQRRFVADIGFVLAQAARLRALGVPTGVAPHSLRAVSPDELLALVDGATGADSAEPIHIHVAEQEQEVADCLAALGARPIRWLLDHVAVDRRWCLVHATHADASERTALAASHAVAGLCPSTEANLGDGVFDAADYLGDGGRFGIGSDSHACISASEELRLLEGTQRLMRRRRNVLAAGPRGQTAEVLWLGAVAGGAQAAGRPVAGLAVGQQADMVQLDAPLLDGLSPDQQLATHVFAPSARGTIRRVWAGGRLRVDTGRHAQSDAAARAFTAARARVLEAM